MDEPLAASPISNHWTGTKPCPDGSVQLMAVAKAMLRSWLSWLVLCHLPNATPASVTRRGLQATQHAVLLPFPGNPRMTLSIPEHASAFAPSDDANIRANYRILLTDMLSYLARSTSDSNVDLSEFQQYVRTHVRNIHVPVVGGETPAAWRNIFEVFAQYTAGPAMAPQQSSRVPVEPVQPPAYPWLFEGDAASFSVQAESTAEECMETGNVQITAPTVHVPRSGTCNSAVVALRFTGIPIEAGTGSEVHAARLHFTAGVSTGAVSLEIAAEAVDDATGFLAPYVHPAQRTRTAATDQWHLGAHDGWSIGVSRSSPDISGVIAEVVNRPGWRQGNAIVLLVSGHSMMESLNERENLNVRR